MAFWSTLTRRRTLKANEYGLLFWVLGLAGILAAFMSKGSVAPLPPEPYQPLEGRLYSGPLVGFRQMDNEGSGQKWPEVIVYVDDVTQLGLDKSTEEFRVKVSRDPKERYKWLLKPRPRSFRAARRSLPTASEPSRDLVAAPPTDFTFAFLDGILQKDESTYVLNARYQRADVAFHLLALCQWRDFYLLKVAVTNCRDREFFITSVEIEANGKSVPSRLYIPFSCGPGASVEGIVTFVVQAVKNQKVEVILIEGGTSRQYRVKDVGYAF